MNHSGQAQDQDIRNKIERERKIIQGATQLKQRTDNAMVIQKCNTNIREAQQNIEYLQDSLQRLSIQQHNELTTENTTALNGKPAMGNLRLSTISPQEQRFSRLDLAKYDCPSLAQRIQVMLQQLAFKLQVEKQYYAANEKMTKLYQIDGDQRTSSAAEFGVKESKNRIQLLNKAFKKYQAINVDADQTKGFSEDANLDMPADPKFTRKQLTGTLYFKIAAIRDVDHVASPIFSRKPETFITVKIDDTERVRTKPSRVDRWTDHYNIFIEKGNEIEITVYDKINEQITPVAITWILLSDIAEDIRKQKAVKQGQNGWVMAQDVMRSPTTNPSSTASGTSSNTLRPTTNMGQLHATDSARAVQSSESIEDPTKITTNAWFVLEPVGQILLTFGFTKQQSSKRKFIGGLNRHGAIIKRPDEVYEQHGHHFVQKSFYNIMCCAYCGDFLRYTGFQCQDCKFLCHKKCYQHVVTKCIAKSSADSVNEDAQLNHRIPHRFEPASNRGTRWCCHCGYILPWGRKNVRKCTECGVMCHAHCAHLVPDFCGMSMETANKILNTIKTTKVSSDKLSTVAPSGHASPGKLQYKPQPANKRSDAHIESLSALNNVRTPSVRRPPPEMLAPQSHLSQGVNNEIIDQVPSSLPNPPQNAYIQQYEGQQLQKVQAFVNRGSQYDMFSQNAIDEMPQDTSLNERDQLMEDYESNDAGEPVMPGTDLIADTQHNKVENHQSRLDTYRADPYHFGSSSTMFNVERTDEYDTSMVSEGQFAEVEANVTLPEPADDQKHHSYDYMEMQHLSQEIANGSPSNPFRKVVSAEQKTVSSEPAPDAWTTDSEHVTSKTKQDYEVRPSAEKIITQSTSPKKHKKKQVKRKKVSLDDFILLKVLGKGNFGKVLLARSKQNQRLCAIKVLKKDHIIKNHDIESARAEKKVFLLATKAKHPFLTNLFCSFQTENRIYFAMEFIGGGDLMWHVQNQRLSVRRAKFYAAEVLLALKYFHDNGVIYRDLKLENILLTPEGHIKIADYGLCKDEMWYGCKTSTFCGTPEFMAPEILKEQEYTKAVDWWAFGVLLYQMLLCQSPFSGDDEDEVFNAILTDEPLYPIDMAGDIVQIFQGLLTKDPEKRLGAGPNDALEVMREPFFRNINFDDILNQRVEPPFVPDIKGPEDTSYFEQEFTSAPPTLTPLPSVLNSKMQEQFRGFSFMPEELDI